MKNIIFGALFDLLKPIVEDIKGNASGAGPVSASYTPTPYDRSRIGEIYVPRGPRGPTAMTGVRAPSAPIAAPVAQRQAYNPTPTRPAPTRAQIVAPMDEEVGGLQLGVGLPSGPSRKRSIIGSGSLQF